MKFMSKTCLIYSLVAFSFFYPTFSCFIAKHWMIHITNNILDDITISVKSGDTDLGNHTIPFNNKYEWSFCNRIDGRTLYVGSFSWRSLFKSFELFNNDISRFCHTHGARHENCYWLVRADGFWISRRNLPFPDSWNIMRTWTD